MIIDAHLHVWDRGRSPYPWLGPGPLQRDIPFAEIRPALRADGVGGVVLVQADDAPGDTEHMLETADSHPEVVGVVAWSPLDDAPRLEADLARFGADARVVGVRNLIHERPAGWIARPEVDAGLGLLAAAGMPLDIPTTGAAGLAPLPAIAERHPGLPLVIDHLGKPPIGGDPAVRDDWRRLLADCARHPLTTAKLSGLYSSVGPLDSWTVDQVRPYVDDALALLGPGRLMFGGDWPIADLAGGYARGIAAIRELIAELSPDERAAILGGTAARVYRLDPDRLAAAAASDPDRLAAAAASDPGRAAAAEGVTP